MDQNKFPHIKFGLGLKKVETPQVPNIEVKEVTPNTSRVKERELVDGGRAQYTRQTDVPRNKRYNHNEDFTYVPHQRRRNFSTPQHHGKTQSPSSIIFFLVTILNAMVLVIK